MWGFLLCLAAAAAVSNAAGAGAARLVCYVEKAREAESFSECTHLVYAGTARGDKLDGLLKDYRKHNPKLKIILRVAEVDKDLRALLKSKHIQGLEISDAHRSLNRTKVIEDVETARSAISNSGGGPLFLTLPSHPELLAKYYDLRVLMKNVDLMMVETHDLGYAKKTTYHPSRLSGVWDMMNTDSVVDLVIGLGVPASKIVISLPATAKQFTLANETLSTPGSPAVEDEPKVLDQAELCRMLQKGRWTAERDQDLSAPYAFKDKTWIAFEDSSSVDVKGKYARVRGLAGLALRDSDRDAETPCAASLKQALGKVLNQQSRAPRAAVLRSLEQEILSAPGHARALDALQVSPYRITQVVDADGVIHSIREDTRTEFSCSRQGYFVHPRSCARFYRCVKFDQLSPEYTVFEFDCPSGLAFDSRYEVCVWPGSLPDTQACPGSSEIAPVPQTRFICPGHEGYYADPENCRWFFACVDHGVSPLAAYEFRCPFGLGFDAEKLTCEWPWLVPACGNLARYEASAHGFNSAILTGATGFHGQTADAINVAAHASLASGASLHNLVGVQTGLSQADQLDANFIASQELQNNQLHAANTYQGSDQANGLAYQDGTAIGAGHAGLVQVTNYNEPKYTSGSIILDDYRLPTKKVSVAQVNSGVNIGSGYQGAYNNQYSAFSGSQKSYNGNADESGAYVHDPSGDRAEPYRHIDSPVFPYIHDDSAYKQSSDYYDYGRYSAQSDYDGKYVDSNAGQYNRDNSGAYVASNEDYKNDYSGSYNKNDYSGSYNGDYSGSYIADNAAKYESGVYRSDGHIGGVKTVGVVGSQLNGVYSAVNNGNYLSNSKAYTGASHTLTAGAVNVGLVGKTTLVDSGYADQNNYGIYSQSYNNGNSGSYNAENSGAYVQDNSGAYVADSNSYAQGNLNINQQHQGQLNANNAYYAGQASNIALESAGNYHGNSQAHSSASRSQYHHGTVHNYQTAQVPLVAQPAVSINHVGTDSHNLDGYSFVTTPTSSVVPTTTTPFASTTALPTVTYKTTFLPEAPKSSVKQIFGISQPALTYVTPTVIPIKQYVTPVLSYSQSNNVQYENQGYANTYSQSGQSSLAKSEASGYDYSKPSIQFEDGVQYSTPAPVVVSTFKPQGFSHNTQTVHNVASGYQYSNLVPVSEEPFKKVVAYTTGPSVETYAQPTVSTYVPQSFSHQTLHKVEANRVEAGAEGYLYQKPNIDVDEPKVSVQYTTAAPAIVQPVISTQVPHFVSQQTLHHVDTSKINTYSQHTGYDYPKPQIKFEEAPETVIQYTTPAPAVVSTYSPKSFSQQTIHKLVPQSFAPVSSTPAPVVHVTQEPAVTVYKNPILKFAQKTVPVTYIQPTETVYTQTYKPIIQQHHVSQISHPVQHGIQSYNTHSVHLNEGYSYSQPEIQRENFQSAKSYSDASAVSHQVYHQGSAYNQNIQHEVSSTPATLAYEEHRVDYESPNIQTYKAPEYIPPKTEYQQIYYEAPQVQQVNAKAYSDASLVSHQVYHHNTKTESDSGKNVFVSTTPANLAYEEHYSEYEYPKKIETYDAPKNDVYVVSSTAATPIVQQQNGYQYQENSNNVQHIESQNFVPIQQVSFGIPHVEQQKKIVESYHISSFPSSNKNVAYQSPEIQVGYKAEEYLPPVVSTPAPVETYTYKPPSYSTTVREYLPPPTPQPTFTPEYLPPKVVKEYLPPQPIVKEYLPPQVVKEYLPPQPIVKEYLPPQVDKEYLPPQPIVKEYLPPQVVKEYLPPPTTVKEYLPPKVEKEYLPPPSTHEYIPPSTTLEYLPPSTTSREYLPPSTTSQEYLPPSTTSGEYLPPSTTARPKVKFTTPAPTYQYVESTTPYKAPEYLPPTEEDESHVVNFESYGLRNVQENSKISYNPYQQNVKSVPVVASSTVIPKRKQNIVVETAKSNLLGFGTVGPDAGLVSYTTSTPIAVSSSESYSIEPKQVTSTYAPIEQEIVEVTPSPIPRRRTKPKVAVVTKINDYNPLLVRKLGAVCSCQSPVVVLKGRRPIQTQEDFDYYNNNYGRGDIQEEYIPVPARIRSRVKAVTAAPFVTSTFNPIIVPDDSYYQDYDEAPSKDTYSESLVSSTVAPIVSTTEKIVRIRPRVKAVTVAPTYKTVLLNQEASADIVEERKTVSVESQSFDRYGPGGLRSRDETLQGSVDCKRAGLFRHPTQCNKFYACRWDCTKERFTLHVFNCPVQLTFDPSIGACNWPSQGPACQANTLLTNTL